jgi:hypothetical protein
MKEKRIRLTADAPCRSERAHVLPIPRPSLPGRTANQQQRQPTEGHRLMLDGRASDWSNRQVIARAYDCGSATGLLAAAVKISVESRAIKETSPIILAGRKTAISNDASKPRVFEMMTIRPLASPGSLFENPIELVNPLLPTRPHREAQSNTAYSDEFRLHCNISTDCSICAYKHISIQ